MLMYNLCLKIFAKYITVAFEEDCRGWPHKQNIFGGYILNMESELFANHCVLLNRQVSPLVSEKQ